MKLVIENYPEGKSEELDAVNHPDDPARGHAAAFRSARELYVERDDFMENPPKKFFRLSPGREVRLRYAYFVTCREVVKDAAGEVVELRCTYDPATRAATRPTGARCRRRCIGWRRRSPCRRRSGSTTRCSPGPIRARAAISWPTSTRIRSKC